MKAMVCEMCRGNDIVKRDGMYVCLHCGTKYSIEEARKLFVEGVVRIDSSAEIRNLFELARRAKNNGDSTNAQRYYEQVVVKDPSSWEASFYILYFQAMNCKIAEIQLMANRVKNSEETILGLIRNNVRDIVAQRAAVSEIANSLTFLSEMLFLAYKTYFDNLNAQIKENYVQGYASSCSACRDMLYHFGNATIAYFGAKFGDIAAACWKVGVRQHNILNGVFVDRKSNAAIIATYNNRIMEYDTSYQPPKTNMKRDGGCYVATAVYGSYNCPEVWVLRRFRDKTLAVKWYGRIFISMYYAISPTLVKLFGSKKWFKRFWKARLDCMVAKLKKRGVESSPYIDTDW